MISEKLRRVLKDNKGVSIPLAIAIVIILILIMTVISEYIRLNIIAQGVRDAFESAIISTVNDNYADVYHGVREGYAGGYQPVGDGFEESVNYGEVYQRLNRLLGLQSNGGYHIKTAADGAQEFKVWGLSVQVRNAPIAPSDPDNIQRFIANAVITLEAPIRFAGKILPPLTLNLKVQAGFYQIF